MNSRHPIIIVGSGMAGMAAADLLFQYGLHSLVIDDNFHVGGQLLRRLPQPPSVGRRFKIGGFHVQGEHLVERLHQSALRIISGAQVLGIYPQHTLIVQDHKGRVSEYGADYLILATGARERYLPFPGWTLPGVISTGAAQILIKGHGILPGKKVVIGGCSPLMLVLAEQILANRGKVQSVLDQSRPTAKLAAVTAGPALWPKLAEGALCLARLAAARVPIRQSVRIIEVRGRQSLETIVAARVDPNGRIRQGTERIYPADTLAIGYGFAPNIELPQQAGCGVRFDRGKGGWYVTVDETMECTIPGIYSVGEPTGIAGGEKSFVEGRIAAWTILRKLGIVCKQSHASATQTLLFQRARLVRYGRFLNRLCHPHPDCYADIPDETVICRCEEITMGEIRRQLEYGFDTVKGIKNATRCGMGNCQARICGPILSDILSASDQSSAMSAGCPSVQAPVKPVALGALARMSRLSGEKERHPN